MRLSRICILLIVVTALLLTACGGSNKPPAGMREVFQPSWYGVQGNPDYVFAYGQSSERTSQQTAFISAESNAQAEAARHVEVHVQSMVREFISEAGTENPQVLSLTEQVVRLTTNHKFSGTQVDQRQIYENQNGRFVAYVRLAIPRSEIDRDFLNRVKNEEALYNEFKASQAFNEMDRVLSM